MLCQLVINYDDLSDNFFQLSGNDVDLSNVMSACQISLFLRKCISFALTARKHVLIIIL